MRLVFWGILAVEMANQLRERGYKVAFLGLIETWLYTKKITDKFYRIYDLLKCGPKRAFALLKKRLFINKLSMKHLEQADFLEKRFSSSAPEEIAHLKELYALNLRIGKKYVMRYYPGHLELFSSSVAPDGVIPSDSLRWRGYCDTYHVNKCPGKHQEILQTPNVEVLGSKINKLLAELNTKD